MSARSPVRLRARMTAVAVVAATTVRLGDASASCTVDPGPEGAVSTWSVSTASGTAGTVRSTAASTLPLTAPTRSRAPVTAFARLVLHATDRRTVHLYLGVDGQLEVRLDDQIVFTDVRSRVLRDDDVRVAFDLPAGDHPIELRVTHARGRPGVTARFTDGDDRPLAPHDVSLLVPGVSDADCTALASRAFVPSARAAPVQPEPALELTVAAPGGVPHVGETGPLAIAWRDRSEPPRAVTVGTWLRTAWPVRDATLEWHVTDASGELASGTERFVDHASARSAVVRAAPLLAAAATDRAVPASGLRTVSWAVESLAALVAAHDRDTDFVRESAAQVTHWLDVLAAHRDPLAGFSGPLRRAYVSSVDGSGRAYSIYAPTRAHDRPLPLIIGLHGLGGSAHRMLAVLAGFYDHDEGRAHAARHLPPLPPLDAILVAPEAFGDSMYRAAGETDVLDVLDDVLANYSVDRDRVYVTGLSMGGTGAAAIAFHHPDRFAAFAPLCGYHSWFVRNDTQGPRRPWEVALMHARSTADFAENGLHLPMYLVHGTLDRPVANSQVLVDRYAALGYPMETEFPVLGHDVWSTTYADGRIVPYFARFHRTDEPPHVRFRTASGYDRSAYGITIDALQARDRIGDVEVTRSGPRISVRTHDVDGITLALAHGTNSVAIDGDVVGQGPSFHRERGHWANGPGPRTLRAGSIRDVMARDAVVVFGASDPHDAAMNERVARAWAVRPGVTTRVPILADTLATPERLAGRSLVLVGTPRSNRVLASIAVRLPVRIEGDAVVAGAHRFAGPGVGVTFAYDRPDEPERAVLVVTGTDVTGIWRSRFLPELVPDFAVYDAGVEAARGAVLLGPARLLAGGFFTPSGAVPDHVRDPGGATTAPR